MKYHIKISSSFKKDYKHAIKKGLDKNKLRHVVEILAQGKTLDKKYKDYALVNNKHFKNVRECHIEPDWLLIYSINNDLLTLKLIRTGSHSDLFNK